MNYSQLDEQERIGAYFKGKVGTFLDIGANDGKTFSNTYALALAGWEGVCVDASPRAFASLKETHKGNDRIQCIHAAVTDRVGMVTLHEASDTLVSSLDPNQQHAWEAYGFDWHAVNVPSIDVPTLFARSGGIGFDFVSIDVEGGDLLILQQMDFDAMGTRLICVEHNSRFNEIKALCPGFREYHRNGINLMLCK